MATEYVGIPGQLLEKVKETADREEISEEELVRDALEQRVNGKGGRFTRFYATGERRGSALPEDVEAEIAASRAKRKR